MKARFSGLVRYSLAALAVVAWAAAAKALTVYNDTPHTIAVVVGEDGLERMEIRAGASAAVALDAAEAADASYRVEITTVDGPLFFSRTYAPAGGEVQVRTVDSPVFGIREEDKNLLVRTFQTGGELFDESFSYVDGAELAAARGLDESTDLRGGNDPAFRNVQFLAIGDPQYFVHNCCNSAGERHPNGSCATPYNHECPDTYARGVVADDTAAQCVAELAANPLLRGVVVAGDLTQTARFQDEYQRYLDSWWANPSTSYLPWIYEGLGNHDYDSINAYAIRNDIRERARTTVVNQGPAGTPPLFPAVPHYSWDWHDVHFVQLNLMPADDKHTDFPQLDPGNALTFLMFDLATKVGNSGRPVVLIHHYGFESFSEDWWTPEQKLAYWRALAPYNVKVILSGHNHRWATDNSLIRWYRPAGEAGPAVLHTVNVAASHLFKYVRLHMGPNNLTKVEVVDGRCDDQGVCNQVKADYAFLKDDAIYVDLGRTTNGDGSKSYPWQNVQDAAAAMNALVAELVGTELIDVTLPLETRIQAGTYSGAVTFSAGTRLVAQNGQVVLGMP